MTQQSLGMSRPLLDDIYMEMAESLSKRSTCKRLSVGTVLVSKDKGRVLSVGYNGNAKGFPNTCDSDEPGNCGCIHSEPNALINRGSREPFIAYITDMPCKMCAKLLVNAGCEFVFYKRAYRLTEGIDLLSKAGIGSYQLGNSKNG